MKKKVFGFLAGILLLTTGITSNAGAAVVAGAGEWDRLLYSEYTLTPGKTVTTKTVNSQGGDLLVSFERATGDDFYFKVYEYDPDNADDLIGSGHITYSKSFKYDVRKFVDGDNKRAEVYVKIYNVQKKGGTDISIWD